MHEAERCINHNLAREEEIMKHQQTTKYCVQSQAGYKHEIAAD